MLGKNPVRRLTTKYAWNTENKDLNAWSSFIWRSLKTKIALLSYVYLIYIHNNVVDITRLVRF